MGPRAHASALTLAAARARDRRPAAAAGPTPRAGAWAASGSRARWLQKGGRHHPPVEGLFARAGREEPAGREGGRRPLECSRRRRDVVGGALPPAGIPYTTGTVDSGERRREVGGASSTL